MIAPIRSPGPTPTEKFHSWLDDFDAVADEEGMLAALEHCRDRRAGLSPSAGSENAQADLELIVRDIVTNSVISESFSTYNLVEHLHFPLPATSRYQLEVHYDENLFGSITAEEHGLAWRAVPVPEPGALLLAAWGLFVATGAFQTRAIRRLPAAGDR